MKEVNFIIAHIWLAAFAISPGLNFMLLFFSFIHFLLAIIHLLIEQRIKLMKEQDAILNNPKNKVKGRFEK